MPLQIGITGGIGSGKTIVCKIFQALGVPIYDADSRAKYLMTTDGILISQIRKEFGDLSYDSLGQVNRKYLAANVFANEEKLGRLNELVHPRAGEDYANWTRQHGGKNYVMKEAALLFETGTHQQLDKIVVVFSPLELRLKRIQSRDKHRTSSQIMDIINKQWPDEDKVNRADYVIYNNEHQLIIPQVLALHQEFLK
ncbi:MAG TPA: dephospho-CoA kinase [Ohtaekwangia sp.]|nr:dephospho-CoA kinase [Ohtaekwangia sp.]